MMDKDDKNGGADVNQLERQLEHSSYYNQTVLSQYANRINELESFVYGLADMLIEKKELNTEELQSAVEKTRNEIPYFHQSNGSNQQWR